MSTLRVIRCEHPDGRRAHRGFDHIDGYPWASLPTPEDDGIPGCGWLDSGWVCAAHENTLSNWFPPAIRVAFREMGFRFVVLDVPRALALCGRMQAVIDRKHAVEVGEYLQ